MNGPTIDEQIDAVERHLKLLKSERRTMNKRIIENRQDQASARAFLKKLKEAKEAGK